MVLPNGNVIEYLVDGFNRRVAKKVNGVITEIYVYESKPAVELAAVLDGLGHMKERFIYGSKTNVPDYMGMNGTDYRVISDQVGTPKMVVNAASGDIVARYVYDEFGNLEHSYGSVKLPFGFAGGLADSATGLVRFGARDYDPMTGRFVSKDPLLFNGGTTNLFEYSLNDPVNFVDLSGLATGQVGVTISLTGFGLNITISAGIAVDTHGNIAGYYSGASGSGTGSSVSGGVSFNGSNANTVSDLNGPFLTSSANVGEGGDVNVDVFNGYSPTVQPISGGGATIGIGEGASSSVTYGPTHIVPFTSTQNSGKACP